MIVAAATSVLIGSAAVACSVPVFRYALDHWPADSYLLEISPADARDGAVARFLRNHGATMPLNLEVVRLAEGSTDRSSRLLFPRGGGNDAPAAWSGDLNAEALAALTNSPARTEIVRRILGGASAVWVLVESGDSAADAAAAQMLEKRLRYLEQVAQLPIMDPNDPASRLGPGPKLAVKFSVLRIPRDAAQSVGGPGSTPAPTSGNDGARVEPRPRGPESAFRAMLAGPKSDLAAMREPWVAVVFGRGRVLGAWPANGFGDEQVDEVSLFLLGACSCQVKSLNPGWDLLLHAAWDEQLHAVGYQLEETSSGAGVSRNSALQPETVSISGGESREVAIKGHTGTLLLGGAAVLLVVLGGLAWRRFAS